MKLVKRYKKWGIYENSEKEVKEVSFKISIIHPNNMGCGLLTPQDSDFEIDTIEQALEWINNY